MTALGVSHKRQHADRPTNPDGRMLEGQGSDGVCLGRKGLLEAKDAMQW